MYRLPSNVLIYRWGFFPQEGSFCGISPFALNKNVKFYQKSREAFYTYSILESLPNHTQKSWLLALVMVWYFIKRI